MESGIPRGFTSPPKRTSPGGRSGRNLAPDGPFDDDVLHHDLSAQDAASSRALPVVVPPPSLAEERVFGVGEAVEVRVAGRHGWHLATVTSAEMVAFDNAYGYDWSACNLLQLCSVWWCLGKDHCHHHGSTLCVRRARAGIRYVYAVERSGPPLSPSGGDHHFGGSSGSELITGLSAGHLRPPQARPLSMPPTSPSAAFSSLGVAATAAMPSGAALSPPCPRGAASSRDRVAPVAVFGGAPLSPAAGQTASLRSASSLRAASAEARAWSPGGDYRSGGGGGGAPTSASYDPSL